MTRCNFEFCITPVRQDRQFKFQNRNGENSDTVIAVHLCGKHFLRNIHWDFSGFVAAAFCRDVFFCKVFCRDAFFVCVIQNVFPDIQQNIL